MSDPASNIAALKRQVDENAFDVVAISSLGEAYLAAGHFMDAVACFGRAIKEDSHPSDYLNQPAFPRWPQQFMTRAAGFDIRINALEVIGVAGHGAGDG